MGSYRLGQHMPIKILSGRMSKTYHSRFALKPLTILPVFDCYMDDLKIQLFLLLHCNMHIHLRFVV